MMLPLTHIIALEAGEAPPGTLLVSSRDHPQRPPSLIVAGQRSRMLQIGGHDQQAFKIRETGQDLDLCLSVLVWRMEVEAFDLVSPFDGLPSPGEAFIANDMPGIIGYLDHQTVYIGLNGMLMPEPNWATFVGFKRWRLVADLGDRRGTQILFEMPQATEI